MKKSLLLSIAASAVVFAGGDIAPVEPVQPVVPAAAPAACDFWGSLAARYDAKKIETSADEFGSYDDHAYIAAVLGAEKDLGYGFGVGAELGALLWTDFDHFKKHEEAELSQLYLTYKYGNTAIKAGRMALPKAVSPLAWSDRTAGVVDRAFNGVTVVNTDLADTTLVGAWFDSYADGINAAAGAKNRARIGDKGIFMLGAINKSIADTTLSFAGYYAPDFSGDKDFYSLWAAAESSINGVNVGLQGAYSKLEDAEKSFGVAGYVGTNYNGFDAKLTLAYLNDGDATLNLGGTTGFWGGTYYLFGGNVSATKGKQKIARLDLGYTIDGYGRVYGGVAVDDADNMPNKEYAARVGYDFDYALSNGSKIATKIEYRYHQDGTAAENKDHRIRVQGVYKF